MIRNNEKSAEILRAEEQLAQAKARLAEAKRKEGARKRKEENQHKYMMGGIVHKYFPEEYADPYVLWNSVEMREKNNSKAQLARSYKISIPNEWSYELATEVVRDYVKRNFVDDGMCVQFAIHDSENPVTHQRNLHCHIMMTMRPIMEDGTWGEKQKKIYILDADGNKIRTKKGNYKCTTQDVTGWNNKENAKMWRKNWADTINAVNEKNGLTENFWEHRSFEAQGLDIIVAPLSA